MPVSLTGAYSSTGLKHSSQKALGGTIILLHFTHFEPIIFPSFIPSTKRLMAIPALHRYFTLGRCLMQGIFPSLMSRPLSSSPGKCFIFSLIYLSSSLPQLIRIALGLPKLELIRFEGLLSPVFFLLHHVTARRFRSTSLYRLQQSGSRLLGDLQMD